MKEFLLLKNKNIDLGEIRKFIGDIPKDKTKNDINPKYWDDFNSILDNDTNIEYDKYGDGDIPDGSLISLLVKKADKVKNKIPDDKNYEIKRVEVCLMYLYLFFKNYEKSGDKTKKIIKHLYYGLSVLNEGEHDKLKFNIHDALLLKPFNIKIGLNNLFKPSTIKLLIGNDYYVVEDLLTMQRVTFVLKIYENESPVDTKAKNEVTEIFKNITFCDNGENNIKKELSNCDAIYTSGNKNNCSMYALKNASIYRIKMGKWSDIDYKLMCMGDYEGSAKSIRKSVGITDAKVLRGGFAFMTQSNEFFEAKNNMNMIIINNEPEVIYDESSGLGLPNVSGVKDITYQYPIKQGFPYVVMYNNEVHWQPLVENPFPHNPQIKIIYHSLLSLFSGNDMYENDINDKYIEEFSNQIGGGKFLYELSDDLPLGISNYIITLNDQILGGLVKITTT